MKKLILSLFMLVYLFSSYSQVFKPTGIPYWDALTLLKYQKDPKKKDTILHILSYYTSDSETKKNLDNWTRAELFYASNKFLKDYINEAKEVNPDLKCIVDNNTLNKTITTSSMLTSVGGLDVTNIADGFAKFIVKRTKQELNIAFFDKFKDELDSFPDIQTVFPQTYRTLSSIGDEIYMYEAYIQTLRESFEKDLASLPDNLPRIIDNHKDYFNKMPELKAMLLSSFYIAQEIQNKQHPGSIIENFPVDYLDELKKSNIKPSFQSLILLSTSIKNNNDQQNYWAPYDDIKRLFSDDNLLKIYLGLLEQKAKIENIVFMDSLNKEQQLYKIIDEAYDPVSNDLPKYKLYIKDLALKIKTLETKIDGLKRVENDSLLFENYYSMISSSIDLMRYLTQVEKLPHFPKSLDLQDSTKKYFDLAQTAADIVIDVNRRNYASAIVNACNIYNLTINKYFITELEYKEAQKVIQAKYHDNNIIISITENGKLPSSIPLTKRDKSYFQAYADKLYYGKKLKGIPFDKRTINKLFKYGTFMAAIAQAKNSDEVESAIEAVALPTGSARIKRETKFNVALNAYCGLFLGHEEEKFSLKNGPVFNSYGVTAPIGVSVNWGGSKWMQCRKDGHFSRSIFLSVIDLGAITVFRFKDDTTQTLSKIELKDIISPGIFYSMGIPKTPISINLGYQITPFLRNVNAVNNTFKPSYSRYSVSICVDIPILNFYTKPKE